MVSVLLKHFSLPWRDDVHARKEANVKGQSLTHFNLKDTHRLKVKVWRKIFLANENKREQV